MTTTLNNRKPPVKDYQPIRCVLEMGEDSDISVIVKPGCSVADVHDMLAHLSLGGGHFEHLTFIDDDDDLL
jgi:hypothetical protein